MVGEVGIEFRVDIKGEVDAGVGDKRCREDMGEVSVVACGDNEDFLPILGVVFEAVVPSDKGEFVEKFKG